MLFDINEFNAYTNSRTSAKLYSRPKTPKPLQPVPTKPTVPPMPIAPPVIAPAASVARHQELPFTSALRLVAYSDKSFAIFGDTKPRAAELAQLGGRFNSYLKVDNVATPGWIFSNRRLNNVKAAFNL